MGVFLPAFRAILLARIVQGTLNFESVQLENIHTIDFPAVGFAEENSQLPETECRAFLGSDDGPTDNEWRSFNASLDGALLKPVPPAAVCYGGPYYNADKCSYLVSNATSTHFYLDDPLTVLTQWTQGGTCMPAVNATGTCAHGGFPVYVVNATTVKHVQAAVNFARNNNLRLVIK
jgi:hypothetical protein